MSQDNKPQDQKPADKAEQAAAVATKPAETVKASEKTPEQLAAEQKVKDDAAEAERVKQEDAARKVQEDTDRQNREAADRARQDELVEQLVSLKARADMMGITYHPNIGLKALQEKVNIILRMPEGTTDHAIEAGHPDNTSNHSEDFVEYSAEELESGLIKPGTVKLSEAELRNQSIQDARRLVRIRATNMNPNKRDWTGEVLTVSNRVVGTHKKFVPFNGAVPYHVPNMIYQMMKERKCQIFVSGKGENGQDVKRAQTMNEFNIEVLPPLTMEEIRDLAQRQAMASGTTS